MGRAGFQRAPGSPVSESEQNVVEVEINALEGPRHGALSCFRVYFLLHTHCLGRVSCQGLCDKPFSYVCGKPLTPKQHGRMNAFLNTARLLIQHECTAVTLKSFS